MDIYVGNIPYYLDEDFLEEIFSFYGRVERVTLLRDNITNKSKGKAFVRMRNHVDASNAIEGLNGYTHKGRTFIVARSHKEGYERGSQMNFREDESG